MSIIKPSVILSLVALLGAVSVFPQKGGAPTKEENLYSMALSASIFEMEKSWGYIDDSDGGGRVRTDYRHMLVEKDPEITDHLPSEFGSSRVEYLDAQAQIDRFKRVRKEFSILRIHPIQTEGSHLKILVSVSYLKYEKGRLALGLSDWSDVEFRFDCEKQNFVVSVVKLGGI